MEQLAISNVKRRGWFIVFRATWEWKKYGEKKHVLPASVFE
jgi:hypothetical protein